MKRTISRSMFTMILVLIPVWGLGCGGAGRGDQPRTHPVSGTVTMKGQPIAGATVNFQSADGSHSAVGLTDAQGRYQLTTFAANDGAVPGEYAVAVSKYEVPPGAASLSDDEDDPDTPGFVPENVLPQRYASADTSGFTASVTEGNNTFDLALE